MLVKKNDMLALSPNIIGYWPIGASQAVYVGRLRLDFPTL